MYGLNRIRFTTDAYLGLPTDILGTEYIVLGYKNTDVVNGSQLAVVGTRRGQVVHPDDRSSWWSGDVHTDGDQRRAG